MTITELIESICFCVMLAVLVVVMMAM